MPLVINRMQTDGHSPAPMWMRRLFYHKKNGFTLFSYDVNMYMG